MVWALRVSLSPIPACALEINCIIEIFESFLFPCIHRVNAPAPVPSNRCEKETSPKERACVRRQTKSCGWFFNSQPSSRRSHSSHTVFTFLLLVLHIQFSVCVLSLAVVSFSSYYCLLSVCDCLPLPSVCLSITYSGPGATVARKETKVCRIKAEKTTKFNQ